MKLKKILETCFQRQPKESNQKLEIYKCKCGQTYARHITRMSLHMLRCSSCPAHAKELLRNKVKGKTLESSKNGFNKKGQVKNLKKILDENFIEIPRDSNQKLEIYKCKHCEQKYARNASRMSLHLQKCNDCPDEVKNALEINVNEGKAHKVTRKLIPKKLLENSFILQPKEPNQKLQTFKCKYCGQVYARHSTRMSLHLQKCIGCPTYVKDSMVDKKKYWKDTKLHDGHFKRSISDNDEITSDDDMIMQMTTNNIYSNSPTIPESNFIEKMTKQRQKYCEELLAKAIYATNAPLSIVDNEHWRNLLNTLSPSFELPNQSQLSTNLLETTYESVRKIVDEKIRDAISIGIQCCYRTMPNNEGIIHFVLTTPDPVLYKTIRTSCNEDNEHVYMEKISEVIEEIGPERILGVCLESISTENLWEILQQKYEDYHISFYSCSSQVLHLILKDIIELSSVSVLIKNVTSILKEIKQSEVVSTLLNDSEKEIEKNESNIYPKVPGIKKLNPSLATMDSLFENKDDLQVLAFSSKIDKFVSKFTKELISDEDLWTKINCYSKLIKPIIKWINHIDDEEVKISEFPVLVANLEQHFVTEFQEPFSLITEEESHQILKRFKSLSLSMVQDIHYAANLLNPVYKGEHLSPIEVSQGQDLITKLSIKFGISEKDVMIELAEYNAGSGVWSVNFVKKSVTIMPPSTWWRGFFKNSNLTKIAAAILDLPSTSTATSDRILKKNFMKNDPSGKAMYISENLRLLDPKRIGNKNKIEIEEEINDEDFIEYNEEIEEVLVEDVDDCMEEMEEEEEEITGDQCEISEEQEQGNQIYLEIYEDPNMIVHCN